MIDVSVIVPIYKVEKFLNRCLDSLIMQSYKNYEIILVDDGSPDNCGAICDEYASKDTRFKVIHQSNRGTGIARNRGLEQATGKYIYFCDPDDYVEPNLIEDNVKLAEKYKANMVLFGYYEEQYHVENKESTLKVTDSVFLESQLDFRDKFESLYKKHIMYTLWNKLYKKDFLDKFKCRFGNEKVGQDTIFNYKVYKNLNRIFVNNKAYYHYVVDRKDSSLNKYREDRFYLRYKESVEFENLIESWRYKEKYKKLVLVNWLMTLFVGINNTFSDNSLSSDLGKKDQIRKFINEPKIDFTLKNISVNEINSLLMKVNVFLLQKKQISFVFYILKFKRFLDGIKLTKL